MYPSPATLSHAASLLLDAAASGPLACAFECLAKHFLAKPALVCRAHSIARTFPHRQAGLLACLCWPDGLHMMCWAGDLLHKPAVAAVLPMIMMTLLHARPLELNCPHGLCRSQRSCAGELCCSLLRCTGQPCSSPVSIVLAFEVIVHLYV